ncbi:Copia protein (Gagint-pol protein), putative [Acanthamoeba castellanii str. Neff]|uniref:Copia protein (Gagint-pol protein), putative n=1 Tax=Acanthamoeba castellanii (strain ATCC 30010 / Neff) TaxID=1257118 RepID=L8GZG3_ACACF|nr:Copia protein (Gagint-pol protein), putative [Acanthamoeba castellanii str. Neff]ELR18362.1 Copia protein (Gagint-pol protein), putative [Acanthamoeba castellanii str. Neff]
MTPMEPGLNLLKLDRTANEDRSLPYHLVVAYSKAHWSAAKHLLQYLQGMIHYTIKFNCLSLEDHTWHSTTGIVCTLLSAPIYWSLKSQRCIALSTCEAEYNSLTEAAKQSVYLCDICDDLSLTSSRPTIIYNNNQAALKIANSNPGKHHPRSKHYAVKLTYLQELIANGHVKLRHYPSQDMPADALTKASGRTRVIEQLKLFSMFDSPVSIKGRVEERT